MDEKKKLEEMDDVVIEDSSHDDIVDRDETLSETAVEEHNNEEVLSGTEAVDEAPEDAEAVEEATEEAPEDAEAVEETPQKPHKPGVGKKVAKIVGGSLAALLVICYIAGAFYYNHHFYHNTTINNVAFAEATVAEVEDVLTKEVREYQLTLQERDNVEETIVGSDVDLKLLFDGSFENLLKQQNPFAWPLGWFKESNYTLDSSISFDQDKLNGEILALKASNEVLMIAPQDAYVDWNAEAGYFVNGGMKGTQIDMAIFASQVTEAVKALENTLNLDERSCYVPQNVDENDQRLINAVAELNKYNQVVVTYNFNGQTEICNGDIIRNWLRLDENYGVVIDADKTREYVDTLGDKYNTYKKTRQFTTHSGSTIEITKGDYGWRLNRSDMTADLVATVREGGTHTKEPMWLQTANAISAQDWGNTYVEINLSAQHLYFYKDGQVIVESNLVSGNVSKGYTTPGGIYSLKWKEKNRVLRGQIQANGKPEYETPVSFWMPFNGGIGMHDATWRGSFGGSIYLTNGSHGCVNLPYSKAQAIYENITSGTPIICYY